MTSSLFRWVAVPGLALLVAAVVLPAAAQQQPASPPSPQAQQAAPQQPQNNQGGQAQQPPQAQQPQQQPQGAQGGRPQTAQQPAQVQKPEELVHSALAYPTGDPSTSTLMLEKRAPQQVRVGQPYRYTISVTNLQDQPLAGVTVVENLGTGMELQQSEPKGEQMENGQQRWNLGFLEAKQTRNIEVTAIPSQEGSIAACLAVTYEPALCTVLQVANPQLRVSKEGPGEAYICDELTYRYAVTNAGTGVAEDVVVREQLPEGLASVEGQAQITHEVGDIPAGETRTFEARLRPSAPGTYTTRAVAVTAGAEAYSPAVTTRIYQPQLAVAVSGPQWTYAKEPVTFQVDVSNSSDATARRAVLRLDTPGLEANERERDLGDIEPGQTKRVSVTVAGAEAKEIRLNAAAESTCAPEARAMAVAEVRTLPALLLEVVDNRDPVTVGDVTTYTVVVKSQGTAPATNVQLVGHLPPGLQFVDASGDTPVQQQGDRLNFGPVRSLAPGDVAAWTIAAKAVQPGDVRMRVDMTSDYLREPTPDVEPTRLVSAQGVPGPETPDTGQPLVNDQQQQAAAQQPGAAAQPPAQQQPAQQQPQQTPPQGAPAQPQSTAPQGQQQF